jgi:hypothetical protein
LTVVFYICYFKLFGSSYMKIITTGTFLFWIIINQGFWNNSVAQETEGSSPHSQQPATGPYLSQSNPIHTPLSLRSILIPSLPNLISIFHCLGCAGFWNNQVNLGQVQRHLKCGNLKKNIQHEVSVVRDAKTGEIYVLMISTLHQGDNLKHINNWWIHHAHLILLGALDCTADCQYQRNVGRQPY